MEVKVSSRLGKMKPRRNFPVLVARPEYGPGFCGHQHTRISEATNCAVNNAKRYRKNWAVFMVDGLGNETRQVVVRYEPND